MKSFVSYKHKKVIVKRKDYYNGYYGYYPMILSNSYPDVFFEYEFSVKLNPFIPYITKDRLDELLKAGRLDIYKEIN